MDLAALRSDAEVASFVGPAERCNLVVFTHVAESLHCGGGCVPHVHRTLQSHRQNVLSGPVDEVQVEVIAQTRSIEDSVRIARDLPGLHRRVAVSTQAMRSIDQQRVAVDERGVEIETERLFAV